MSCFVLFVRVVGFWRGKGEGERMGDFVGGYKLRLFVMSLMKCHGFECFNDVAVFV